MLFRRIALWVQVSAAMGAGLVCTTASVPFENVKTVMQVAKIIRFQ